MLDELSTIQYACCTVFGLFPEVIVKWLKAQNR